MKTKQVSNSVATTNKAVSVSPDMLERLKSSNFIYYVMDICKRIFMTSEKDCSMLKSLSVVYHCELRIPQEALYAMLGKWYIYTHDGESFGLTNITDKDDVLFWLKLAPDGSYIPADI